MSRVEVDVAGTAERKGDGWILRVPDRKYPLVIVGLESVLAGQAGSEVVATGRLETAAEGESPELRLSRVERTGRKRR